MSGSNATKIEKLMEKGVRIDCPDSVEIGAEVDPDRIAGEGVRIYSGCRLFGSDTLILPGASLGYEAPVTVENCQIGPDVELRGGFFKKAVFLGHNQAGLGSHVRGATILEEQANIAHTVALKQTILFPFVTLGSLINFCDCLMAGGTSRKNHSEVGSSYIHFNYTPNQDKATASLIGDVPRGVMLNQNPIFLGGQGGMVGPCRLGYGVTVAAGTILRKDETRSNRLIMGGANRDANVSFTPGKFRNDKRIIANNINYIANLIALKQWYDQVRRLFIADNFPPALLDALQEKVDLAIEERLKRLEAVCLKKIIDDTGAPQPPKSKQAQALSRHWPEIRQFLELQAAASAPAEADLFLESVQRGIQTCGPNYIRVIQGIDPADTARGIGWLQGVVDDITAGPRNILPTFF